MTRKQEKLAKQLSKCAGKYVATYNDEVIACGDSIEEVEKKAAERNVKRPVIFPVPELSPGNNFF